MATLTLTDTLLRFVNAGTAYMQANTAEAYSGTGTATTGAPRLVLGGNTPSGDDSCVLICRKLQGTSLFSHAIRDESTFSSTLDSAYCSFDSAATMSGATAYNHWRSFQSRLVYTGSGSLGEANGYSWNFAHTGTGTVSTAYGMHLYNPTGTGTITSLVGIYIEALTRGTSNFSIYSSSTALAGYHGGFWQIGNGLKVDTGGANITGTLALTGSMSATAGLVLTGGNLTVSAGTTTVLGVHAQCLTAKGTVDSFDAGGTVLQYSGAGAGSVRVYGANTGLSGTSFAINLNGTDYATVNTTGLTLPSASVLTIGSNQVLGSRKTGWAAATGTATRTTFATGSVTLPVLAEHVKALIDDFISHGAIGA